jgi:hypothetical protein
LRPFSIKHISVLLLVFTIFLSSCGVKSPPKPPEYPTPGSPENVNIRVRGECVEMSWRAPKVKDEMDAEAKRYEILRAVKTEDADVPAFFVLERTSDTSYRDCGLPDSADVSYQVRGISGEDRRGEKTKTYHTKNIETLEAPHSLITLSGDRFIELSWQIPEGMPSNSGVNIYRSKDPDKIPWRPINQTPIIEEKFADGPLKNGSTYYYEVRSAIVFPGNAVVESETSLKTSAAPNDKIPPSRPQGIAAAWVTNGVQLNWLSNHEDDLAGYIVYRRRSGVGSFKALLQEPHKENIYLDMSAKKGIEYEYSITAIDNSTPSNQSPVSESVFVYTEPL